MARLKPFILKFCACLIILVIADRAVGVVMKKALANGKNGPLYRYDYMLFKAKPGIVILGSSRAKHHYNTSMIQDSLGAKTINYGFDGTGIFLYYVVLNTLMQHTNPALVVLDIRPDEFEFGINTNWINTFYPILDRIKMSDDDIRQVSKYEKIKLMSCSYRYNNQFLEILQATHGHRDDTAAIDNYVPLPVQNNFMPQGQINSPDYDSVTLTYLIKIINLCQAHKSKLVICVSPDYFHCNYSRTVEETQKACAKHGVLFLNYLNNQFVNFDQTMYSDPLHLNSKGANLFTNDLIGRIK